MKNVSVTFKNAIKEHSRKLSCKLEFSSTFKLTDEEVVSIDADDSILTTDKFELGGAIASTFDIEVNNYNKSFTENTFLNKWFKAHFGILNANGAVEELEYGTYIVKSVEKQGNNLKLDCFDSMINFDKKYSTDLVLANTAQNILIDCCKKCNVNISKDLQDGKFINAKTEVSAISSDYTFRQVVKSISCMAGAFAIIRNNILEFVKLTDTTLVIDDSNSFQTPTISNTSDKFTAVSINNKSITGAAGGKILYVDIPILEKNSNKSLEDVATEILKVYNNFSYTAFKSSWQGDFSVDPGDKLTVKDREGKEYKSFISMNKISYKGGLKSDVETKIEIGEEKVNREAQGLSSQMQAGVNGMVQYSNSTVYTIPANTLSRIGFLNFGTGDSANLLCHVSINIKTKGLVKCTLSIDSNNLGFIPMSKVDENGIISFTIPLLQMTAGEHSFVIQIQSSASITIDVNQVQIVIYGANIIGGLSAEIPHAEVSDNIATNIANHNNYPIHDNTATVRVQQLDANSHILNSDGIAKTIASNDNYPVSDTQPIITFK